MQFCHFTIKNTGKCIIQRSNTQGEILFTKYAIFPSDQGTNMIFAVSYICSEYINSESAASDLTADFG